MTPSKPHLRALYEDEPSLKFNQPPGDAVVFYVTRRQTERESGPRRSVESYPRISRAVLKKRFTRAIVLHPLPRVDELSPDMDSDHRSKYFMQAGYGVPVRMALMSLILKLRPWRKAVESNKSSQRERPPLVAVKGIECKNPGCVTGWESHSCSPQFQLYTEPQVRFACPYCEQGVAPVGYGIQQHGAKIYQPIGKLKFKSQHQLFQFRFFSSEEEAEREGFVRASSLPERATPVFEVAR